VFSKLDLAPSGSKARCPFAGFADAPVPVLGRDADGRGGNRCARPDANDAPVWVQILQHVGCSGRRSGPGANCVLDGLTVNS
jgi:hypothetical protein